MDSDGKVGRSGTTPALETGAKGWLAVRTLLPFTCALWWEKGAALRGREQSAWLTGGAGGALLLTAPAPQKVSMSRVPVCGSWLAVVPDPSARHAANWEMQDHHPLHGSRQPPAHSWIPTQ